MNPLLDVYGTCSSSARPCRRPSTRPAPTTRARSRTSSTRRGARTTSGCRSSTAIAACGGDAIYQFEAADDPFLDHAALEVDGEGGIHPAGSRTLLGKLDEVMTGRVFAANGPWVTRDAGTLRAVMPNMLAHRKAEEAYYRSLLGQLAAAAGLSLAITDNPHRWEGMADVATVGDRVVLTYAVPGHYDASTTPKSSRSSRDGVAFAADRRRRARGCADLRRARLSTLPRRHRSLRRAAVTRACRARTLHGRPLRRRRAERRERARRRSDRGDRSRRRRRAVRRQLAASRRRRARARRRIAARSSVRSKRSASSTHRVPLFELFGKAGGGPACATLYLPRTLEVPVSLPLRYSATRDAVRARGARIPETLRVDRAYLRGQAPRLRSRESSNVPRCGNQVPPQDKNRLVNL